MQESLILGGLKGFYDYSGRSGNCELRILEAGLVVDVELGEPLRFPYSKIAGVAEGDHSLIITMGSGEKLTISRMGGQLEPFKNALNDAMNKLTLKTQVLIKSFAPAVDSSQVRSASGSCETAWPLKDQTWTPSLRPYGMAWKSRSRRLASWRNISSSARWHRRIKCASASNAV